VSERINTSLDDVFRHTPIGSIERAVGNTFYGINHQGTPNLVPSEKINQGLTFFTRPQLNLTSENLRGDRRFNPLLTLNESSIQRIVRCYLDPRLNRNALHCPFVDTNSPFIPILTNQLKSLSPWPDEVSDTYSSEPGRMKESYTFIDGANNLYGNYDMTATFRNTVGSPIMLLFRIWRSYASAVFQGKLLPYPDYWVKKIIDYNLRYYRLALDKDRRIVKHIACVGAAIPLASPYGAIFNYDDQSLFAEEVKEIQIPFRATAVYYDDPIIIHWFNRAVQIFNRSMRVENIESSMQEIPIGALSYFKHRGYPRIDPNSYELKWFVPKSEYANTTQRIRESGEAINLKDLMEAFK